MMVHPSAHGSIRKISFIFNELQVMSMLTALCVLLYSWEDWNDKVPKLAQDPLILLTGIVITLLLVAAQNNMSAFTMCIAEIVLYNIMSFLLLYMGIVPLLELTPDQSLLSREAIFGFSCILAAFAYVSGAALALYDFCILTIMKKEKRSRRKRTQLMLNEELKQLWLIQEAIRNRDKVTARKLNRTKQEKDKISDIPEEEGEIKEINGEGNKENGTGDKGKDSTEVINRRHSVHFAPDNKGGTKKEN